MTATTTPAAAPPLRRDRMVHGWMLVKGTSDAGDAAWTIALAWTAVHLADPTVAGLVVTAGTVPRAAVLLVGGVVADRFPTRTILAVTTGARIAVLAGALAVLALGGPSVPLLLAVAVGFGLCDAVFEPAAGTLSRQLVHDEDLAAMAGATQTGSRIGIMAGSALGGGLVVAGGLEAAALLNAATYALVLGYVVLALRPRFPLPRADRERVLRSIRTGFGYLGRDATARTMVIALSGLNLAVGPALALGVALRAREEQWGAGSLGLLQALVGLGAIGGAVVLVRWRPRRQARLGLGALVVQGLAIVVLAMPYRGGAAAACLVVGVTAGTASAVLSAVFVRSVAAEYLGRVSSILRLGDDVLMPVSMTVFGAVAAGSLEAAFVLYGGAMAALMLATLRRPGVRRLDA